MEHEQNDQVGGMSDHEKFGETGSFDQAAAETPHVYDKTEEAAATARERAVQLKTQLADKLETSAEKLRRRTTDTARLDEAIATTKEKVAGASDRVASGMEKSADWLRSANASSFQQGLQRQVKQNPGRMLLIAGAIGYMLGRALKGKSD